MKDLTTASYDAGNFNRGVYAYDHATVWLQLCKVTGNKGTFQVEAWEHDTTFTHVQCEIDGAVLLAISSSDPNVMHATWQG